MSQSTAFSRRLLTGMLGRWSAILLLVLEARQRGHVFNLGKVIVMHRNRLVKLGRNHALFLGLEVGGGGHEDIFLDDEQVFNLA